VAPERDLLKEECDAEIADDQQDGADRNHCDLPAERQGYVGDANEADGVRNAGNRQKKATK